MGHFVYETMYEHLSTMNSYLMQFLYHSQAYVEKKNYGTKSLFS